MRRLVGLLATVVVAIAVVLPVATSPAEAYTGDDTVAVFGDAPFLGSTSTTALNQPLVGFAPAPDGAGYWLLGGDGGVFTYGSAHFFGSTGGMRLNRPVVGIAPVPDGSGYWLVASDGGVFSFGSAQFYGSTGAIALTRPIIAMRSTPSGHGYWLVASDGGVFTFGDAVFLGSTGDQQLAQPIVGFDITPTGGGYWMLGADGIVHAFGDAPFAGNAPGNVRSTAIAGSPDGDGYRISDADGGVYPFGTATFAGSAAGQAPFGRQAYAIASTRSGNGYWVAFTDLPIVPGASGPAVTAMQQRLDALGYWLRVDGRFTSLTTQALYALQKAAGIPRTGLFDGPTRAALAFGVRPAPRTTAGYVVEVDKTRQLLMLVRDGNVVRIFNTSTGSGAKYRSGSGFATAFTPEGSFAIYKQVNGTRISSLGVLWRPKYFTGGYAIHGNSSVPPYPASHGCVRVSNDGMNWMWDTGALPIGTRVLVYR